MAVRKSDADKALSPAELERFVRILRGAPPAVRVAFLLQLNLGLRVSEVLSLRASDVSERGRSLTVRTKKRRAPVVHTLEVPRPLAKLLREQVSRAREEWPLSAPDATLFPSPLPRDIDPERPRPMTARALQYQFRALARAAGIESGASTHALRHTRAMNLYRVSRDPAIIARELRHADRRSADAYIGDDEESYRRAVSRVPCYH